MPESLEVTPGTGAALWRVTVAEAAPAHNQLIQRIVIFLQHLRTPVKQVITQSVQFSEVYPEISDPQQIWGKIVNKLCDW